LLSGTDQKCCLRQKMSDTLFSVTAKDCEWDYFSGSGAGGQHRNKHKNCVRVVHKPSGARGSCQDHRELLKNKRTAFARMARTSEMQKWLRVEAARMTGALAEAEQRARDAMQPHNLKIERQIDGRWENWV